MGEGILPRNTFEIQILSNCFDCRNRLLRGKTGEAAVSCNSQIGVHLRPEYLGMFGVERRLVFQVSGCRNANKSSSSVTYLRPIRYADNCIATTYGRGRSNGYPGWSNPSANWRARTSSKRAASR